MIGKILVGFGLLLGSSELFANTEGFVKLASGHEVYVNYEIADSAAKTVVLLNGLTWETSNWDAFVAEFRKSGFNILRYDARGQGKSLEREWSFENAIAYQEQVADLNLLLDALSIKGQIHLVGLSYGGGLAVAFGAKYPARVGKLVLLAPYTQPVAVQDTWIKQQIIQTRILFPLNPATDDELYDYFLRNLVYSTYPAAEPSVLDRPGKLEAVYLMTQGIRKLRSVELLGDLPARSLHLVVALEDQYVSREELDNFWKDVPEGVRHGRIYISKTQHKIPEAIPAYIAEWLALVLNDDERVAGSKTYIGDPDAFKARSGEDVIDLKP
jgi:pimeloyl-ACP methyl ester carboxylesterase